MAVVAAVAALALVGAACGDDDGGDPATTDPASIDRSLLGTSDPASGEPVKLGFISDGKSPAVDNTIQFDAAAAVTSFLNEYRGGIGGRPIELVTCETQVDPAKAADCATEFIQEDVLMTVAGESTSMGYVWQPLHDAGIPIFVYGSTETSLLLDRDSTFALSDQTAGLATLPIHVAKENNLTKVTVVVIDVPVATGFYDAVGEQTFGDAGLELEVIAIPPGQADMTPQMSQIASGGPTAVHIIGNDSFCISAFQGLQAAAFDGPISVLNQCVTDSSRRALGDALEGVYQASLMPLGDTEDPDLAQWAAIVDAYGDGEIDLSNSMGPTIYLTMMAMREALEGITGDITSATIIETIKAAPEQPLPAGGGQTFQCNGTKNPLTPANCTKGALLATLDAEGNPTLPYRPIG